MHITMGINSHDGKSGVDRTIIIYTVLTHFFDIFAYPEQKLLSTSVVLGRSLRTTIIYHLPIFHHKALVGRGDAKQFMELGTLGSRWNDTYTLVVTLAIRSG